MADNNNGSTGTALTVQHKSGLEQIGIYFGKFLRSFIYQNDWIKLFMSMLIAILVGFALSGDFRVTREGTLTGGFAVICVCLWNGMFNSIQVICRERDVVKREHRSGMKVYAYILSHFMYQLLLCLAETIISVVAFYLVGFDFSGVGIITPWLILDVTITLFLVTLSSDLLSLFISALVKTTTTAMTIMPFVLIFQLVFSGGLFPLPGVVRNLSVLTISGPGFNALSSEFNVNELPYKAVADMLEMVDDVEFDVTLTGEELIEMLNDTSNPDIQDLRATQVGKTMTVRELTDIISTDDEFADLRAETILERITLGKALSEASKSGAASQYKSATIPDTPITVGMVFDFILNDASLSDVRNTTLIEPVTVGSAIKMLRDSNSSILNKEVKYYTTIGEVLDSLKADGELDKYNTKTITYHTNLGKVLDKVGRDETTVRIEKEAKNSLYDSHYEYSKVNLVMNWIHLLIFVVVFTIASMIALLFVDKDKR